MIGTLATLVFAATVVLDPGHGGAEDGAAGPGGVLEKNLALAIALEARAALTEAGVTVRLTRSGDETVGLSDRVAMGRDADAFVSIHLNASPARGRRGVETYVASVEAMESSDSAALVAREEPSAVGEGAPTGAPLTRLLDDLDQQAAHQQAAQLASDIQGALGDVEALRPSRGLRQAPFLILKRARVPAVLVEVGYVSHPEQARYLATPTGRQVAGRAVAAGVLRFLGR